MSLGGGADELSLLGLVAQPTTAILWALLAAVLGRWCCIWGPGCGCAGRRRSPRRSRWGW